ncbi:MAG TPA: glycosyltransferase family 39 protein [Blastocatellia bacterium]|nr:glycosyltransferase family 39 protein [Blastocatellia bacterium]
MNEQAAKSAFRIPHSEIIAGLICLLYFAFLVYFSRQHPFGTYATETDFYHLYAPDAVRIAAGQFPLNSFQAPGYPVLLSLVTKLTGDLFVAGKWISIISAVMCVWLMFALFKQLFGEWIGVGAALLSTTVNEFPEFSLQATTDVFFLLLCLVALVIFTGAYFSVRTRVILAAFFTGVAYLTRYNGVFLLACFVFAILVMNLFEKAWRERTILTGIFLAAFIVTILPWLIANAQHNGSPFYNTNYLNMATLFYPELADGEVTQDGTRKASEMFHSFSEVLSYKPTQAIKHYFTNLASIFWYSWNGSLVSSWLGLLGLLGAIFSLADRKTKPVRLLLLTMAAYFLLMGLNHWEARYFFFIGVCYAGLASYLVNRFAELASERKLFSLDSPFFRYVMTGVLLAVVWAISVVPAKASFGNFLHAHPYEIPAAAQFLQSTNAAPHSLKILARKPHLPFMAKQNWVFFPQVKSLEELKAWLETNRVDYIAIGKRELKSRKELAPLGDPKTAPDWLQAAWTNDEPKFILYKPNLK